MNKEQKQAMLKIFERALDELSDEEISELVRSPYEEFAKDNDKMKTDFFGAPLFVGDTVASQVFINDKDSWYQEATVVGFTRLMVAIQPLNCRSAAIQYYHPSGLFKKWN